MLTDKQFNAIFGKNIVKNDIFGISIFAEKGDIFREEPRGIPEKISNVALWGLSTDSKFAGRSEDISETEIAEMLPLLVSRERLAFNISSREIVISKRISYRTLGNSTIAILKFKDGVFAIMKNQTRNVGDVYAAYDSLEDLLQGITGELRSIENER